MKLNIIFFARLRREMGLEKMNLEITDGADVKAVAAALELRHGLKLRGCMVAVNETYASPKQVLKDGDEVAFLPPVAGGSAEQWLSCEVLETPLSLEIASTFLVRPEYGAQAYFVGTVRSPNQGKAVQYIDYEGFIPMAEKVMSEAAYKAAQQYGELRVFVQHRIGRLYPAEASILIGIASPHRRAALEACELIIEDLKVNIPVWKNELDENGEHWVDGQTNHPTL